MNLNRLKCLLGHQWFESPYGTARVCRNCDERQILIDLDKRDLKPDHVAYIRRQHAKHNITPADYVTDRKTGERWARLK